MLLPEPGQSILALQFPFVIPEKDRLSTHPNSLSPALGWPPSRGCSDPAQAPPGTAPWLHKPQQSTGPHHPEQSGPGPPACVHPPGGEQGLEAGFSTGMEDRPEAACHQTAPPPPPRARETLEAQALEYQSLRNRRGAQSPPGAGTSGPAAQDWACLPPSQPQREKDSPCPGVPHPDNPTQTQNTRGSLPISPRPSEGREVPRRPAPSPPC